MAELDKGKPVSLEELMLTTLAQTDALTEQAIESLRPGWPPLETTLTLMSYQRM